MGLCLWECIEAKGLGLVRLTGFGDRPQLESSQGFEQAGKHWVGRERARIDVWGGNAAFERLFLSSSAFLFFPRSKRDVLNGFYGLSGHGVHVGIVDGGSRGVEMPAAAEEGCHGAYVIAAG